MIDLTYHLYTKEQLVLLYILFYPCITFNGLKQVLFVNNICIRDDYLRKIVTKLINKKFVSKARIEKQPDEIKDERHINKCAFFYHIKKKGFDYLMDLVKEVEAPLYKDCEYYYDEEVENTLNLIYEINNKLLKDNSSKQKSVNVTDMNVRNIDDMHKSFFQTIHFLLYHKHIEILEYTSFYIPKHIFDSFFIEESTHIKYVGITINISAGDGAICMELYYDLSNGIKISSNLTNSIKMRCLNLSKNCKKNGFLDNISFHLNFDFSRRKELKNTIKGVFVEAALASVTEQFIIDEPKKYNVVNSERRVCEATHPQKDDIITGEIKIKQLCTGNFYIKTFVPYNCNYYGRYYVKHKSSNNKELESFINDARRKT